MASWGKAKLSTAALLLIEEVNNDCEEEPLDGIQRKFLRAVQTQETRACSSEYFGLLKDFPPVVEESHDTPCADRVEKMEIALPPVDLEETIAKIVEHVKAGSDNINVIIELVSQTSDSDLDTVMSRCWSLFSEDEHKKSFIIAMSATRNSAVSVSSTLLLPLFLNTDSFFESLNLYTAALGWLDCNISHSLVVPLLMNENSSISQDIGHCKAFIAALTDSQRTDALISFSQTIQCQLHEQHLQPIGVILEFPLEPTVLPAVTSMLAKNINKFATDRLMGKIVLSVISLMSHSTPQQIFHDVSSLASNFKGPLRFRHKQALEKVSKQIL